MTAEPHFYDALVPLGFQLSKIVILDAVPPGERQTGLELFHTLDAKLTGHDVLTVERGVCGTPAALLAALDRLSEEASQGIIPLIHIECHGGRKGLSLPDKKTLEWHHVAKRLNEINLHTGFNLVVVLAACFGSYLINQGSMKKPWPCWCLIAPTSAAKDDRLLKGFELFYGELLTSFKMENAIMALQSQSLGQAQWHVGTADYWFWFLVRNFLEIQTRGKASSKWAKRMQVIKAEHGLLPGVIPQVRSELADSNWRTLMAAFPVFFQYEKSPVIARRFAVMEDRFRMQMLELAATGKYLL